MRGQYHVSAVERSVSLALCAGVAVLPLIRIGERQFTFALPNFALAFLGLLPDRVTPS